MSTGALDISIMFWVVQGNSTDIIPAWIFDWHPKCQVERSSVQLGEIIAYIIYNTPARADRVPNRVHEDFLKFFFSLKASFRICLNQCFYNGAVLKMVSFSYILIKFFWQSFGIARLNQFDVFSNYKIPIQQSKELVWELQVSTA